MKLFSTYLNESSIFIRKVDDTVISWNNNINHDLITRITTRTKLRFKDLKEKFTSVLTDFKNRNLPKGSYVLNLKVSEFKIVILWNETKIIVKTILAKEMKHNYSGDIILDLNECIEFLDLDFQNCTGTYFDTILVEEENDGSFKAFMMNELLEQNVIEYNL